MSQREDMRKKPFWYFLFDQLWPFNFQFGCRPKSSNLNILVSAHPIWKLKIVPKISRPRESMVRNLFWYFECFTSKNPYDSSNSPRANSWPVTLEKFSRHGFSVFHLNLSFSLKSLNLSFSLKSRSRWHFGCLIQKTLYSASNNYFEFNW